MLLLKVIWTDLMDHFCSTGKDPRTKDLPLTSSYSMILLFIGLYALVVLKIGPKLMEKRKPYNIKSIIQFYNVFQIFMNLYIFYGLTKWRFNNPKYSWTCMKYDPTDTNPATIEVRKFVYLYFINKILDCLETIFFVLRKKFKQVSFLHVYHHTIMIWGAYIYIDRFFGSQFAVIGHVNSLVHVLMYTYYILSTLDTNWNIELLKPLMTKIQILQFFYFSVKVIVFLINNSWCGLPNGYLFTMLIQNLFMTAMFSHFYWKTYVV